MADRPLLLWLASVQVLAAACTTRPPETEGMQLLSCAELPGRDLSMLQVDEPLPGFYAVSHRANWGYIWHGYGDLCTRPGQFHGYWYDSTIWPDTDGWDSPAPHTGTSDTSEPNGGLPYWVVDDDAEVPWDAGLEIDILDPLAFGDLIRIDCTDDLAYASEVQPDFLEWLGTIDNIHEAALVVRHTTEQKLYHPSHSDDDDACGLYWTEVEGGWEMITTIDTSCSGGSTLFRTRVYTDGRLEVVDQQQFTPPEAACGRLTTGVRLAAPMAHTFASYAGLEAAAAIAFDRMADQLTLLGAPADLIADCRTAADEERVHARLQTDLAAAHGLMPARVDVDPFRPVSLYAFALDNRLEGCVRETFGAMTGRWQADRLPAGPIRDVWQQICADEEGHAALSWRIAAWAEARLSDDERAELDRQAAALLATLADGHDAPEGLPVVPEAALRLFQAALSDRIRVVLAA